jgi:hypothetical protein
MTKFDTLMREYARYIINNEDSRHWLSPREQKDLIQKLPCTVVYEVPNAAHSVELLFRQGQIECCAIYYCRQCHWTAYVV